MFTYASILTGSLQIAFDLLIKHNETLKWNTKFQFCEGNQKF